MSFLIQPYNVLLRLSRRLILLFLLLAVMLSTFPLSAWAQDGSPSFAGTLAVTGSDGNIYLLSSSDTAPVALTTDAERGARRYVWPTWSTDGRLAIFSQEAARGDQQPGNRLKVFISQPETMTPALAYESTSEVLNYAYWSPANCATTDICRDLALLVSSADGLRVLRIRDEHPAFTAESIGLGQPFYYSFSPDGSQMLWARFGRQLDLYDTARNEIVQRLPDSAGFFQAPMWSPVDSRLLFSIINDKGEHDLVIADGDNRRVIANDQPGSLWFSWSPDGTRVAYKRNLGSLIIVDTRDGSRTEIGLQSQIVAFFWAPDSKKIAYLTLPDDSTTTVSASFPLKAAEASLQAGLPTMNWHVADLMTGTRRVQSRGFIPTRDMLYLVAYFDQFAQSHQLWSPDSRYLVYGEILSDGQPQVRLLDADQPAVEPFTVAEGSIGIWSFR